MKQIQKVLVVNCGSSSLKFQLFDMKGEKMLCKGLVERIGLDGSRLVYTKTGCDKIVREVPMKDHVAAIGQVMAVLTDAEVGVIASLSELDAIGHRVVHGGDKFSAPAKLTAAAKKLIAKCIPLAPLHNPANLQGIEACEKAAKGVPNVGVFDTAFHQTMPGCAYEYALPRPLTKKYGLRKYGFHGTSHKFLTQAAAAWLKKPLKKVNLVTCHLGNGSSISAVKDGKVLDTSMGFTPLAGIEMGTRCGDIDPAIVPYIMNKTGMNADEMNEYMNKKCGFLGVSGISSDCRDVSAAAKAGNKRAQLALDIVSYQIRKFIGAYTAAMGGLDAIVFTAGIGENDWEMRESVCSKLGYFGVEFDAEHNAHLPRPLTATEISKPTSKVKVFMIPTNEELVIASDTERIVKAL